MENHRLDVLQHHFYVSERNSALDIELWPLRQFQLSVFVDIDPKVYVKPSKKFMAWKSDLFYSYTVSLEQDCKTPNHPRLIGFPRPLTDMWVSFRTLSGTLVFLRLESHYMIFSRALASLTRYREWLANWSPILPSTTSDEAHLTPDSFTPENL